MAVVFLKRGEERLSRNNVHVKSGFVVIPIGVLKRPLGVALLGYAVLFR
jgi:hypothetical protein